jgi:hypothetical protein
MTTAFNCAKPSPRTWRQKNWLLHHDNAPSHTSFSLRNFNTTACPPKLRSSVFPIEDKIERPPFWHNSGDRGRITRGDEHLHRTRFRGWSAGNSAYARKGTTSRVLVASRPKGSFWPDGSTRLGNHGWLFVYLSLPTFWNKPQYW